MSTTSQGLTKQKRACEHCEEVIIRLVPKYLIFGRLLAGECHACHVWYKSAMGLVRLI
jgi:hypothetical protein